MDRQIALLAGVKRDADFFARDPAFRLPTLESFASLLSFHRIAPNAKRR